MKQSSLFWILGMTFFSLINSAQAIPASVYNYPHYLNGKSVPPEQKTPHSSCCHCEEAAKYEGEQLLRYYVNTIPNEPFTHIDAQQLSWSPLHKRYNNHLVSREIYLITFIQKKHKEYKILATLDSTEEECGLFNRFYTIDKFLDENFSHPPTSLLTPLPQPTPHP
ncbi:MULTISPECIES: hypothetical protein [unclassified Saccharibacter]|uniref:hypothetical protein n=1 Tax=unclassified Saccharibacter TaxID=2648722 RepID=UPI00132C5505|nr:MULTISPECIES: hypothetical protein [unclassified Saccharibacter]MXV36832.1 hypothetical protein [Saccharibacter sp. EH611]MXV58678.1 hypothetical protein [Saccharibacter sp. EH70]MXV66184.1 hypothetical protein [Saccharibacter sp. EH60]